MHGQSGKWDVENDAGRPKKWKFLNFPRIIRNDLKHHQNTKTTSNTWFLKHLDEKFYQKAKISKFRIVNARILKNEFWKQGASTFQNVLLTFALRLKTRALKTVGWTLRTEPNKFNHMKDVFSCQKCSLVDFSLCFFNILNDFLWFSCFMKRRFSIGLSSLGCWGWELGVSVETGWEGG